MKRKRICLLYHLSKLNLKLRASRHEFHRLPHTQITQDLLRSTKNSIKLVRPVEHLDHASHSSLRQTTTAKDSNRLISNFVSGTRAEDLQKTDGSGEMLGLLIVWHFAHLVCDTLDPCLGCFDVLDHLGELLADHGLRDQGFAEDDALVGPFEAFFYDCSGPSGDHGAHHVTLVVEV